MPVNNDMFPGGSSTKDMILNYPRPPSLARTSFTPGSPGILHITLPQRTSCNIWRYQQAVFRPIHSYQHALTFWYMLYCGLSSILSGDNKCSTYYTLDSFKKFYTSCILELLNGWKGKIIWKCIARTFSWRKDAISFSDLFFIPVLFFIITFLLIGLKWTCKQGGIF